MEPGHHLHFQEGNLHALAQQAYDNVQHRTAGEREIELALFTQITQDLTKVAEQEVPAPTVWAEAISRNLELWSLLASDLLGAENTIADELKGGLLYLSEFVRTESMRILSGEGELRNLIDINISIMQGLSGQPVAVSADGGA